MDRFSKAAEFGAIMGFLAVKSASHQKQSFDINNPLHQGLLGAAVGGGGTALYDLLAGNNEDRLTRALLGAGIGGAGGVGLGALKQFADDYASEHVNANNQKVRDAREGRGFPKKKKEQMGPPRSLMMPEQQGPPRSLMSNQEKYSPAKSQEAPPSNTVRPIKNSEKYGSADKDTGGFAIPASLKDNAGAILGAGLGGGGTALYDYITNNQGNRLLRALGGAGAGALGGVAADAVRDQLYNQADTSGNIVRKIINGKSTDVSTDVPRIAKIDPGIIGAVPGALAGAYGGNRLAGALGNKLRLGGLTSILQLLGGTAGAGAGFVGGGTAAQNVARAMSK